MTERRCSLRVNAAAPQALQVDVDAVEIAAHARNLRVEIDALLRLRLQTAENEESTTALAALAAALRHKPVELGLLAVRRILVAADLIGSSLIAGAAAIDGGKLPLKARAKLALVRRSGWLGLCGGPRRPGLRHRLRECRRRQERRGGKHKKSR